MKKTLAVIVAALSFAPAFAAAPAGARFLALGDSYTVGTSVPAHDAWPWQLTELLRHRGVPCQDPVIIAHEGWTAGELVEGIDAAKPQGTFDVVTVMVGVNNQFRGGSTADYRREPGEVFKRAFAAAGGDAHRIIGLTIPDYGVTPFAQGRDSNRIALEINQFNDVFRQEAHKRGVRTVNVTTVSRFARSDKSLIAEDGLHPSARLHSLWARLVYRFAQTAIQPRAKS